MSERGTEELEQLTAELAAIHKERIEAYLQSDWKRVWELTNHDIPRLEHEIESLATPTSSPGRSAIDEMVLRAAAPPLDFDKLHIELLERKNWLANISHNPRFLKSRVRVLVEFSKEQQVIIGRSLRDHIVFYEYRRSQAIRVDSLLDGPWTSDLMSAVEAANTAENAREGINDLRLIIQGRANRQ